jgi:hypothetical protein
MRVKEEVKEEDDEEGGIFSRSLENSLEEEDGMNGIEEEAKAGGSEKNIDDIPEFVTPEEEKEGKYFPKSQDFMMP